MTNVITFIGKVKAKAMPGPFTCSLNRALLTVQYCALVLHDEETAIGILQQITAGHNIAQQVTLPGEYRDVVENTDTAATYRAVLGVGDE